MRKALVLLATRSLSILNVGLVNIAEAAIISRASSHSGGSARALRASSHATPSKPAAAAADVEFDKFLENWFNDFTDRKPMEALRFGRQSQVCSVLRRRGSSIQHPIWGDPSAAAETEGVRKDEQWLSEMKQRFGKTIGARDLSDERYVSYVLMQKKVDEMRQENKLRFFRPPFGPLGCQIGVMGCQVQVAGMIRGLDIKTVDDARCYVALLDGLPDFLLGHGRRLQEGSDHGVPKYRLVLEGIEADCTAMLPAKTNSSTPRSNAFFEALEGKLNNAAEISGKQKQALLDEAANAIEHGVWPAYRGLRQLARSLLPKSLTSESGLVASYGAQSDASAFYNHRVQLLGVGGDAASLHERALKLVKENAEQISRSAREMLPSSERLSADSPSPLVLQRVQSALYETQFSNTEAGRASYLREVEGYIDVMWKQLRASADANAKQRLFFEDDIPALPCTVKRMESPSFPGLAQYNQGAVGKVNRSADVKFNVYDMTKVNKMDMEVLAYHEVVPGHHLQVTKAMTLPLPSFRRFFGDEAFSEGWAVYAEQDISPRLVNLSALSRLGRLNMVQTRAVRLAVDTGLHYLNWSRKQAETFYTDHTMISAERAKQAVDRHFVWPAQALNYAVGHQELKRLREAVVSKPGLVKALGSAWEAMLHKAVLSHGDLPLSMLEQVVFTQLEAWRPESSLRKHIRVASP